MAQIQDLPVELILQIFREISNGSYHFAADCQWRNFLAFSQTCKYIMTCFKKNELNIFSHAAKLLVPAGPELYDFLVKLACLRYERDRPDDPDIVLSRVINVHMASVDDILRPAMYGFVLKSLTENRTMAREHLRTHTTGLEAIRVQGSEVQHPWDYLYPGGVVRLPPAERKAAYSVRLTWQMMLHKYRHCATMPSEYSDHLSFKLAQFELTALDEQTEPSFSLCEQDRRFWAGLEGWDRLLRDVKWQMADLGIFPFEVMLSGQYGTDEDNEDEGNEGEDNEHEDNEHEDNEHEDNEGEDNEDKEGQSVNVGRKIHVEEVDEV